MIELKRTPKFGRIYQVTQGRYSILQYIKDVLVIQTFGTKLSDSVGCTSAQEVELALKTLINLNRDILIISISTTGITLKLQEVFRLFTSLGINIYLYTFENKPMWFADEVLCENDMNDAAFEYMTPKFTK